MCANDDMPVLTQLPGFDPHNHLRPPLANVPGGKPYVPHLISFSLFIKHGGIFCDSHELFSVLHTLFSQTFFFGKPTDFGSFLLDAILSNIAVCVTLSFMSLSICACVWQLTDVVYSFYCVFVIWIDFCFSSLTSFFPIVDTCLSCEDTARQSCAMLPRSEFLVILWVLHF